MLLLLLLGNGRVAVVRVVLLVDSRRWEMEILSKAERNAGSHERNGRPPTHWRARRGWSVRTRIRRSPRIRCSCPVSVHRTTDVLLFLVRRRRRG
jgi:hypothetical protein